jgi:cytochrome c peroxidase
MRDGIFFCRTARAILGSLILVLASASITQEEPAAQTVPAAAATDVKTEVLREWIGQRIFVDTSLSEPAGVSCASCHEPSRAFTGDNNSKLGVARGSKPESLGTRNTPTLMYLATAPEFKFSERDGKRVPVGGFFWDGRAATHAAQAKEPLLNPLEMNNADAKTLVAKVAAADYAPLIRRAFGANVFADPERAFDAIAISLAAFQSSASFAPFTSKFDAVVRGQAKFTEQEERGFGLFTIRQKGNCAECHTVDRDSKNPRDSLFTNFGYHALGLAREASIPRNQDRSFVDMGLCGPHRTDAPDGKKWCGFFKTPTLRNIDVTAPYMHNGRFTILRDAVAFYATRDTDPERWYPKGRFDDLPTELHGNVDRDTPPYHREAGKRPALNDEEIDDIVVFLKTLTDGWKP